MAGRILNRHKSHYKAADGILMVEGIGDIGKKQKAREGLLKWQGGHKMKKYVVSYDQNSKQYYAHMEGYNYIPVSGSFCEKRRDALEYAKMMMCLPNRVQQIEDKRWEDFYNYINGD